MGSEKKQDYVKDICSLLEIDYKPSFFSTGSKVTREAIRSIFDKLSDRYAVKRKRIDTSKQGLIRHIAGMLGLIPDHDWFSTGSTVTQKAFSQIFESLQRRKAIEDFEEKGLVVYHDRSENVYKTFYQLELEIENQLLSETELAGIIQEVVDQSGNELRDLIIKRIKDNPHFKFISYKYGEFDRDTILNEVEKSTSQLGDQIIKIEKQSILLALKHLENQHFNTSA